MRYVKPHYYDSFVCTADKCPDTCCAGWQIVIDEESLETYSQVTGPIGNRLYESIDWEEGTFKQNKRRCSFLNGENLCDLYSNLGEKALCRTCAMYPRHVEEFEGLRELSLSLSCPVAAEMILKSREPLKLLEEETGEEEELEEEFEDFDLLMFTQLEDARGVMFEVLQNRKWDIEERIRFVMDMAKQMQCCIEEERYCDVDEMIGHFRKRAAQKEPDYDAAMAHCLEQHESRYTRMCREYTIFGRLERLRPEWSELLEHAWMTLYEKGEEAYNKICREFQAQWGQDSEWKENWALFGENLMLFFLYTYFCGAVYDDWIESKVLLAEFSTRWIREFTMARWAETGQFSWEDCVEIAYRYAREIEHSDENLNLLEEFRETYWL